ncbi:MAG: RnfABCDGE type electron transport complex subunit D [Candidatus Omnitrophica bacterium]|nr:RnfABCDGE type electron transport complex subunit D [Candidatus Omnitrophota bacterium]
MKKLIVTISPHERSRESIASIMWGVVIALLPATVASVVFFKFLAIKVIMLSVATALGTEYFTRKALGRSNTISDGSAVVTGILFAFCVPPTSPWWMVMIGSACAICLVKELFGGLGANIFNPALTARAILLASFPVHMTTWIRPFDAIACATPLGIVKEHLTIPLPSYMDLFLGNCGGCIGETSALAILIGGLFLLYRKTIYWYYPVFYIGVVFTLSYFVGRDPLYEILAGGVFLGAFFMITDMVTTPITRLGGIIFACGAALLTVVIRNYGGYPEGVCYSILIMNAFTPLIDRLLTPRILGAR